MDQLHAFLLMKNKTVLIAIVITAIAAFYLAWKMKKQAAEARQVSNDIMEQFKKVDESLQKVADSIEKAGDSFNKQMEKQFDSSH